MIAAKTERNSGTAFEFQDQYSDPNRRISMSPLCQARWWFHHRVCSSLLQDADQLSLNLVSDLFDLIKTSLAHASLSRSNMAIQNFWVL